MGLSEKLEARETLARVQGRYGIVLDVDEDAVDLASLRDYEEAMGVQSRVASRDGRPVFQAAFPMGARRVR